MGKQKRSQKAASSGQADMSIAAEAAAGSVNGTSREVQSPKRPKKGKYIVAEDVEGESMPTTRYKESNDVPVDSAATAAYPDESDYDESAAERSRGRLDPDSEAAPTLAERIRLLSVQRKEPLTAEQMEAAGIEPSAASVDGGPSEGLQIAKASVAQTLVQALHSGDSRLLEACLQHSERKLVQATVQRLPNQLVLTLVEELVARLSRKKGRQGEGMSAAGAKRAKALIEWVTQVLTIHISYLLTIHQLVEQLSALHATLQARIDLHNKLLALNGRLDLVLSQLDRRPQARSQIQRVPIKRVEPRRYVEGESSTSGSEAEVVAGGSEDEGSIEDVVLESGSDSEEEGSMQSDLDSDSGDEDESDEDGDEDEDEEMVDVADIPHLNGFLDVEADESGSDEEEDDDDDDDDDASLEREGRSSDEDEEDDDDE